MSKYKYIVTHGGVFHADDVLACALTRYLVAAGTRDPELPIYRRDPTAAELVDPLVIKIDVGGAFDVSASQYDHHQRGGAGERDITEGYGLVGQENPLAAAGLIWNCFPLEAGSGLANEADRAVWHAKVDALLFRGVDATDCGKAAPEVEGSSPSVSKIISWMNPGPGATPEARDAAFESALDVAMNTLCGVFLTAHAWTTARAEVYNAPNVGGVLELQSFVPWNEHVFNRPDAAELVYVIYPSERGGYCLQQIPVKPGSFEGRKPLPAAWAGLRGEALAKVTGVDDAEFTHPGRFIGGAKSLEGTRKLAELAQLA